MATWGWSVCRGRYSHGLGHDLGIQTANLCKSTSRLAKNRSRPGKSGGPSLIAELYGRPRSVSTNRAPDEYAALFEAAYPSENDRRTYIAAKLAGAKPSYGHMALATFMRASRTKIVWTTNFDPLVADACAKVYDGTGHLTTVALDAPDLARDVINGERWPAEIKLHGDFRSAVRMTARLLPNGEELSTYPAWRH